METAAGRPREAQRLQSEPPKQSKAKQSPRQQNAPSESSGVALRVPGFIGPQHRSALTLSGRNGPCGDGRTDGWMDGWVDGWMDGRTDGWMDGWMHPVPRRWNRVSFSLISACSVAAAAATRPAFRCRCATPASPNGRRGLNRITLMSRERKGRCAGGAVGSRTPRSTQAGMAPSAPLRTHASPSAPNCT